MPTKVYPIDLIIIFLASDGLIFFPHINSNDNQYFVGHGPFNLVTIFSSYLTTGSYFYSNPSCQSVYQTKSPVITDADVKQAFNYAGSILASKFPEYSNNARYNGTLQKEIEGHLMELASEYFAKL
ncbi:hypothetical protein QR98_0057230 [Sarcoptes scabiei]|uniref:Uncharacterized protein n=1 Tax=Sarcoptes scabiei TaxID=52283 RepID=A0A132A9F9_SARSC|nr:hypothetical protein QR98_0057230 [Sarcoptes scabiei]